MFPSFLSSAWISSLILVGFASGRSVSIQAIHLFTCQSVASLGLFHLPRDHTGCACRMFNRTPATIMSGLAHESRHGFGRFRLRGESSITIIPFDLSWNQRMNSLACRHGCMHNHMRSCKVTPSRGMAFELYIFLDILI